MAQKAASHTTKLADSLEDRLGRLVHEWMGNDARLVALAEMPDGHAGLTFGFRVRSVGTRSRDYILKMAPAGVPLRGSTDIYRQVPLLAALHEGGFSAPEVVYSSPDPDMLGAPFIIMDRLPGRTFFPWDPGSPSSYTKEQVYGLWVQTAQAMGALHAFDWHRDLPRWEEPASLGSELARWADLLKHMQDPRWHRLACDLQEELRAGMPDDCPTGLIHGDLQPGNLLFDEGQMAGVIDWDLAAIGPQGIDTGWLMMMVDQESWHESWRPIGPPAREEILEAYLAAGGRVSEDLGWYQAFAHFRLAAIAGLNLKLHRTGRRIDETWERFVPSIERLLVAAPELIAE